MTRPIRLAVRGLLIHRGRLLIVNAYGGRDDLWCAPGGGADPHQSLPENLAREIFEETGLTVRVGLPCLVNEFHDPERDYHQVEIFFRCTLEAGELDPSWQDPEKIVSHRRWVSRDELATLNHRPRALGPVAWQEPGAPVYDPLEPILR